MKKRVFFITLVTIFLGAVFYQKILLGLGNYLVVNDVLPKHIDALFVLSGGPYDRANKAAQIVKTHQVKKIVCTGGNVSADLKVFRDSVLESDLTAMQLRKDGVDSLKIETLKEGTSTLEEQDVILKYCLKNNVDTCVIVSSAFHTRRIKSFCIKKLEENNICCFIAAAPSTQYSETTWWKNEYGLIALNNEYIKLCFYLIKKQTSVKQ